MLLNDLAKKELITPPSFILTNTIALVNSGSAMYGSNTKDSDFDCVGIVIPPKECLFPHLTGGYIFGYDTKPKHVFEQWIQHGVVNETTGRDYDFTVYNIAKYLALAKDNNPNILEILFASQDCILHSTRVFEYLREHRKEFLSKKAWHTYKGYAFAQSVKMKSQTRTGKRADLVKERGFDPKFAAHLVRLVLQVGMILTEGDLDPRRHAEQIKAVRRGDWTLAQVEEFFQSKLQSLEPLYESSPLPWCADADKVRGMLVSCLEMHYGKLSANEFVKRTDAEEKLDKIRKILEI